MRKIARGLSHFLRLSLQHRWISSFIFLTLLACLVDVAFHRSSLRTHAPLTNIDPPFASDCVLREDGALSGSGANASSSEPTGSRANATILMLARNSDLEGVKASIQSLEEQWNGRYQYPIVMLNNEIWNPYVIRSIQAVTKSEVTFGQITPDMWSWPENVDKDTAVAGWQRMDAVGAPHATEESYRHMCRFFSSFFFDHPSLSKYRYFWRVEPDVQFTCRIPYDPFQAMAQTNKIYGYTIALWELGSTCPSLYRTTSDFKKAEGIESTSLWNSMLDPSWAPSPLRWFFSSMPSTFPSRTSDGDKWNHCHFWSNFEIADLDFFRSQQYRSYIAALEQAGGFFTERWGDAPIHSLALAMFARPDQLHYFEDIGYSHSPFQHCPSGNIGCDCSCDPDMEQVVPECLNTLREGHG